MSEEHKENKNSLTWGSSANDCQCKVYFDTTTTEEELERNIKMAFKGKTLINTIRTY